MPQVPRELSASCSLASSLSSFLQKLGQAGTLRGLLGNAFELERFARSSDERAGFFLLSIRAKVSTRYQLMRKVNTGNASGSSGVVARARLTDFVFRSIPYETMPLATRHAGLYAQLRLSNDLKGGTALIWQPLDVGSSHDAPSTLDNRPQQCAECLVALV